MRSLTDCKRVFFLHMRKAGGTTVRAVLRQICQRKNIAFEAGEGRPLEHFGAMDEDTFLVMNFRHPVERICTHYNAEGRRSPPQAERTEGAKALEHTKDFAKWFERKHPVAAADKARLWLETKNYYVKTLSVCNRQGAFELDIINKEINGEDYHSAIARLQRVDLVLVCEWLQQDAFVHYLAKRLLGSETLQLSIPRLNRTMMNRGPFDIRRHLSDGELQRIADANRWDMELYRFVCWRAGIEAGIDMGDWLKSGGV